MLAEPELEPSNSLWIATPTYTYLLSFPDDKVVMAASLGRDIGV
jgi:hypothetical protein